MNERLFLSKFVQVEDLEACWPWLGARNVRGYGKYCGHPAHRVVWEWFNGPISDTFVLDHLCGVKECVRPKHLEQVSGGENTRRYYAGLLINGTCRSGLHQRTAEYTYRGQCRPCANKSKTERRRGRVSSLTLESKYVALSDAECWLWQGTQLDDYGTFGKQRAHRAVYLAAGLTIPDGYTLDHLCYTPLCVNPNHLEPVTRSENSRRANARQWATGYCLQGHVLRDENIYVSPTGRRQCRSCKAIVAAQREST